MAPSASKQKRLAEKAAKKSASGTATPASTVNGGSTPLTSLSNTGSTEDLVDAAEQMKKLNLATDRSAVSYILRGCEGEGFASESELEPGTILIYRTVFSFPTPRVEISRLTSTFSLSTVDF
jgi:hypothetical protein